MVGGKQLVLPTTYYAHLGEARATHYLLPTLLLTTYYSHLGEARAVSRLLQQPQPQAQHGLEVHLG